MEGRIEVVASRILLQLILLVPNDPESWITGVLVQVLVRVHGTGKTHEVIISKYDFDSLKLFLTFKKIKPKPTPFYTLLTNIVNYSLNSSVF